MVPDLLSNIELYYSSSGENGGKLILTGAEAKHAAGVMRHKQGDVLFVTDGRGKVFEAEILEASKGKVVCQVLNVKEFTNELENICFVIPRLKNPSRFEFALEKSVELGITDFIVFDAERSVAKGSKLERWRKITESAMKQSLHGFLSVVRYFKSLKEIPIEKGDAVIIFEQESKRKFFDELKEIENENKIYFIFGPEGGLTKSELQTFKQAKVLQLTKNRLRSETAIITAASAIALLRS